MGWQVGFSCSYNSRRVGAHDTSIRSPLFILDAEGRIVAIFVGTPEDPDWPDVIKDAVAELNRAREEAINSGALTSDDGSHRRGDYFTALSGASLGGGQRVRPT